MSSSAQPRVSGRRPDEVARIAELEEPAQLLARENPPPRELVAAMAEAEMYSDAVKFLAHSIPKREAIWWAWFCARRATADGAPPAVRAALDATERWVAQPNEHNRRGAMRAAEAAEFGTPAGCAALAAFLSGGSVGPPDTPPVPPGEFMTAKAVAGAIILAAVSSEPEKAPEKFKAFVEQGLDVARRIKLWEPVP